MHQDQHRQMLRLGAAAAMQTHCGLGAVASWEAAGKMPYSVQIEMRDAYALAIGSDARREVRAVYERWQRDRAAADPVPYPDWAEPGGRPTRFPLGSGETT